jgi:protein-S-isoprenylcysteine O-methyltransferase Ste14
MIVSAVWVGSEIVVGIIKRSGSDASRKDRGSLWTLWIVISLACFAGSFVSKTVRSARTPPQFFWIGIALIILGVIVRAIAIATLWRYFTIDVAIASGHELIDRGIYSSIRHPAYTGSLISFVGLGLAFRNWISLAVVVIATFAALSYRVRVEEAALIEHFGDRYREYMKRTKRFVPGVA